MNSEMVKQRLLTQQAELEARVGAIESDFKKGRSQDFAEQATENENNEVLVGLKDEAEHELAQIKTALQMLENGSYGDCRVCGESIAQARLDALPLATDCINCAE